MKSPLNRKRIADDAKGCTITNMYYEADESRFDGGYWVLELQPPGGWPPREICVRLMAEIVAGVHDR